MSETCSTANAFEHPPRILAAPSKIAIFEIVSWSAPGSHPHAIQHFRRRPVRKVCPLLHVAIHRIATSLGDD